MFHTPCSLGSKYISRSPGLHQSDGIVALTLVDVIKTRSVDEQWCRRMIQAGDTYASFTKVIGGAMPLANFENGRPFSGSARICRSRTRLLGRFVRIDNMVEGYMVEGSLCWPPAGLDKASAGGIGLNPFEETRMNIEN